MFPYWQKVQRILADLHRGSKYFLSSHRQCFFTVLCEILKNQRVGSYQIVFEGLSEEYRHICRSNYPVIGETAPADEWF
jgi:hypothetical protein